MVVLKTRFSVWSVKPAVKKGIPTLLSLMASASMEFYMRTSDWEMVFIWTIFPERVDREKETSLTCSPPTDGKVNLVTWISVDFDGYGPLRSGQKIPYYDLNSSLARLIV